MVPVADIDDVHNEKRKSSIPLDINVQKQTHAATHTYRLASQDPGIAPKGSLPTTLRALAIFGLTAIAGNALS